MKKDIKKSLPNNIKLLFIIKLHVIFTSWMLDMALSCNKSCGNKMKHKLIFPTNSLN